MTRTRDLPKSNHPRTIVEHATSVNSAVYSFATEAEGDFWNGRSILQFGKTSFEARASMRCPRAAIAMAMVRAAQDAVDHFRREYLSQFEADDPVPTEVKRMGP